MAQSPSSPAARFTALHEAVNLDTGGLADGPDYDWIEQPREQVRRQGIRARLHLADLLAEQSPSEASDLAQTAAELNRYNEDAARYAMRTLARIGYTAGIHRRLQRLHDALDEIGEEPAAETIAVAAQLVGRTSGAAGSLNEQEAHPKERPDTSQPGTGT
ncbi:AfsR/SARP family transcriptional regulator [Actinoplanes aureus]|uniref:Bacterial transcriptional activator domain-containing protein n=1 Tax=Actinoplanes aureus TaxID=2792083 RepID=A0A931G8H2_9ACTN|nr:bacterial transcriptional activator domain-containing protein [Actinoplanes aureus]